MTANERKFYIAGYKMALRERAKRYGEAHPGRPRDDRKAALAATYSLSERQLRRISQPFLDQLDRCKDDDARRILLGEVLKREAVSA